MLQRSKPKGLIDLTYSSLYPVHDSLFGRWEILVFVCNLCLWNLPFQSMVLEALRFSVLHPYVRTYMHTRTRRQRDSLIAVNF